MADDMMNLRVRVEKTPDADLLREMIGVAVENLLHRAGAYRQEQPSRDAAGRLCKNSSVVTSCRSRLLLLMRYERGIDAARQPRDVAVGNKS